MASSPSSSSPSSSPRRSGQGSARPGGRGAGGGAADAGRVCPSCGSFVGPERKTCERCRLEVGKMDAFAAAKKMAEERGLKMAAAPKEKGPPIWPKVVKYAFLLMLVAAVGWGVYVVTRPKPPRWYTFPGTAQDAVRTFLGHISAGADPEYDAAYGLVADSVRDPKDDEERGNYRQLYHNMNLYLSGEFGENWIARTQLEQDTTNPNVIDAHVGPETLHISVANQTKPGRWDNGPHFAIERIAEFNVRDAAGFRQMAAIEGILGGVAGQGAVDNLEVIRGAGAAPRHETPMQTKVRLLPILRNPRTATWKAIIHLYPLRNDPVVRARLEQISTDDRYEPELQQKAQAVLKDRVPEEDLAAAGVE